MFKVGGVGEFRVQGLGGLGFRVQGVGFRVQGSGFRVKGVHLDFAVHEALDYAVRLVLVVWGLRFWVVIFGV